MEIGGVSVMVAFLAGLASCISPCVLPLAPLYAGTIAGGSGTAAGTVNRRAPLLHAASFMAGFSLFFILLGVSVGLVGFVIRDQLPLLEKIGGAFLILMGLHMSRIIEIPAFYRGIAFGWPERLGNGYVRSFLAGTAISAGWIPCIGPTLGLILTLAITSGTVVEGGVLLFVYSLGVAVPFVGVGALFSGTPGLLRWMSRHYDTISFISGVIIIAMGIILFTGTLQRLNQYFNFSGSGLGANI